MKISEMLKFKTGKDLWFAEEENSENKRFWNNKQICYHYNYKNGKCHGIFKDWDRDGELRHHELWENNKKIKDFLKDENK